MTDIDRARALRETVTLLNSQIEDSAKAGLRIDLSTLTTGMVGVGSFPHVTVTVSRPV